MAIIILLELKEKDPLTKKEGDKKFSMNQNLTVLFVLRRTLRIMMEAKRLAQNAM